MHSLNYQIEQLRHDILAVVISSTVNLIRGIISIINLVTGDNDEKR
jgi:hypothetical protein